MSKEVFISFNEFEWFNGKLSSAFQIIEAKTVQQIIFGTLQGILMFWNHPSNIFWAKRAIFVIPKPVRQNQTFPIR